MKYTQFQIQTDLGPITITTPQPVTTEEFRQKVLIDWMALRPVRHDRNSQAHPGHEQGFERSRPRLVDYELATEDDNV